MLNPLDLIPPPWNLLVKVVAPLLVALALFGGGYYKGYQHERVVVQTKTVNHIMVQYKNAPKEQKAVEAIIKKVATAHDTAVQKLPEVVTTNPACDLTVDAIRLLNSVRGSLSPQP